MNKIALLNFIAMTLLVSSCSMHFRSEIGENVVDKHYVFTGTSFVKVEPRHPTKEMAYESTYESTEVIKPQVVARVTRDPRVVARVTREPQIVARATRDLQNVNKYFKEKTIPRRDGNKEYPKDYCWPLKNIYVTAGLHGKNAVDLRAPVGTPVFSVYRGQVKFAERNSLAGKYVVIIHDNGIKTVYCHLSKLFVRKGDVVTKGEKIGLSGNTGFSTGAHLHFGIVGVENPFRNDYMRQAWRSSGSKSLENMRQ